MPGKPHRARGAGDAVPDDRHLHLHATASPTRSHDLAAPGRIEGELVHELGRLDAEGGEAARDLPGSEASAGSSGDGAVRRRGRRRACRRRARARRGHGPPRRARRATSPCRRRRAGRAGGSRARSGRCGAAGAGAPTAPPSQRRRPVGPPGLRLEVHVVEGVVLAVEARGRAGPHGLPRGEVLVEQRAAPLEGDAERLVLVPVPADRRLHDEPALREEVERAELACAGAAGGARARSRRRRRGGGASSRPRSPRAARAS